MKAKAFLIDTEIITIALCGELVSIDSENAVNSIVLVIIAII